MQNLKFCVSATLLTLSILSAPTLLGHGGGVDKNGCHTDGKTNQHHCHTSRATSGTSKAKPKVKIPASNVNSYASKTNRTTMSIQKELVRLGYFPGNTVGHVDAKTTIAIKHFQQDIGLQPTGVRSQELLKLMQFYQSIEQ